MDDQIDFQGLDTFVEDETEYHADDRDEKKICTNDGLCQFQGIIKRKRRNVEKEIDIENFKKEIKNAQTKKLCSKRGNNSSRRNKQSLHNICCQYAEKQAKLKMDTPLIKAPLNIKNQRNEKREKESNFYIPAKKGQYEETKKILNRAENNGKYRQFCSNNFR